MNQEIHFVTGKGGVGKSLVAAALALRKSQEGQKTLLVELGDKSFFQDFFDLPPVTYKPTNLKRHLDVALWSGADCLREYAIHLIKIERLYRIFFENAVMRAFMNVAPALHELAVMGKITSGPRRHGPPAPYDCLVIDAFATGHFQALMRAAPGMQKAVPFGPMGEQSRGIEKVLRDPAICRYHIVTLPEELPLKEAQELRASLKSEFQIDADLIVNKVLPDEFTADELKTAAAEAPEMRTFVNYLRFHLERQEEMLQKARTLDPKFKKIPLLFAAGGWPLVDAVKEAL